MQLAATIERDDDAPGSPVRDDAHDQDVGQGGGDSGEQRGTLARLRRWWKGQTVRQGKEPTLDFSKVDEPVRAVGEGDDEGINVDNIHNDTDRPTGTSSDAALRRLRKDRPDLHEQVLSATPTAALPPRWG